ncbi:tyrosine-type recombinase/integrase [Rhodohalobacter sulfatireducens]|uniref:Tyrosine-type recombinase/integrase n=1 Tax=Rhodohalobacter sulfatireducens TaxID=2911366 RepID=A0ABS9KAD3_9BACT|nr:site-specific integrase [Rhodohalobacter sulfatireducens]MCG2587783.1 tyrosine-type recombinase/integrase [Rhodohalobacter sulfatireducens]
MASLKKRGKNYSIVFKKHIDGKPITKTYAIGTKYKKIAEQKKVHYEKLYDSGKINPFDPEWNLKDYEEEQIQESSPSEYSVILDRLIDDFLDSKTGVTQKTKDTYEEILKRFSREVGKTMPIQRVNSDDVANFCLRKDLANASKKNYHRHLKAFFNWLVEKGIIEKNPCKDVSLPKVKDNLSEKIIEERHLDLIFESYRKVHAKKRKNGDLNTSMSKKNWFRPLVMTGFYTGMRRKELIQLKWANVHLNDRMIRITDTKSGKERTVPIFDPLYKILKAWYRLNGRPSSGLVFPHPNSTSKHEFALTGDHIYRVFKRFVKKAGLKKTINIHSLRHSCATFLFRNDFDSLEIKKLLGHSSLEVTNRYVQLVTTDLLNKAEKTGLITEMK